MHHNVIEIYAGMSVKMVVIIFWKELSSNGNIVYWSTPVLVTKAVWLWLLGAAGPAEPSKSMVMR